MYEVSLFRIWGWRGMKECLDKGDAFSGNSQIMSMNMVTTFLILKFSLMCWKPTCSPPISNGSIVSTMSSRKCLYLSFSTSSCTSDSSVLYLVGFDSKHVFSLCASIIIYNSYLLFIGGVLLGVASLLLYNCVKSDREVGVWTREGARGEWWLGNSIIEFTIGIK